MNKLVRLAQKTGSLYTIAAPFAAALPKSRKFAKYRNMILATNAFMKGKTTLKTSPVNVRLAPTALCNYRCLFCEIHKDNVLFPKRSKNEITLQHVKNYEGVLASAYNLSFFGGSEEPLIAKEFGAITEYMKVKYDTRLMVNTNASLMKGKMLEDMVKYKFDYIIVSYHAGTQDGYQAIMTGKIDKVNDNLAALRDKKREMGHKQPVVAFNFALQRLNSDEYEMILERAKELEADHVIVNRYYGGRNKLQDKLVSYEYNIEEGNQVLDDIYAKAKGMGVKLQPEKPEYWETPAEEISWDENDINENFKCELPWTDLHFNPVLDRANSHYVGVCNRAELFKIDYNLLNLSTPEKADKLWNHSVLKHLRETVNKGCDSMNPLCRFCKNNNRADLRNVNSDLYAQKRDEAVEAFFTEYHAKYTPEEIAGLEILEKNPYEDKGFKDKLDELAKQETAEKRQLDKALDEEALEKAS